ncbi:uroporphyrinogen-III C-methyltransferase [Legionella maioricensis]|uniref:Uroporphyrinogen-III C-methyltransferase n=1 Tax=Legionella maioricensis TaxID=2896528 RepID=A0A9X2D3E6_9GAMM|nr:uroporphyrinogen-III C-methyltransferase [Legionella maioricensis]MCL9685796.1 uroporphyrinogen-III C-methyltransferase [Legionella maioricensis]MCL9689213.1 uroporphyrinogen-III C-methyltransferase [Legionella maioricensis]
MANSNEEEQKKAIKPLKQNAKVESSKQPQELNNSHHPKSNSFINGLAIFIAVASMAIAICALQTNYKLQANLANKNSHLKAEIKAKIAQLKQTQTDSQEQVETKTNELKQTQGTLQNKIDQLSKQLQTAMDQKLYQNQDWLLLKARYYLELAQINAHWSDNFDAAISLLQQADKLLEQLPAPKIFTVRQAIAKEIAQLKAIPTVDIAGLLSQLDAAQISISNLTIQATIDQTESATEAEPPKTANPSAWQTRLQDSVNLLEKMVVIRRSDENIKPLMSPLYESILRESIRLNLQEAQWAIINNNPVVYQLALKQATLNLKRTFNQSSQNTAALLKQLNELQEIKITQEKPVINLALPLLNQMIDNKQLLVTPANNGGKGEN